MRFTVEHYSFHQVGRITVPPERIDRTEGVIYITPRDMKYLQDKFKTDSEEIMGWAFARPRPRRRANAQFRIELIE